jgi:hypothetical protein
MSGCYAPWEVTQDMRPTCTRLGGFLIALLLTSAATPAHAVPGYLANFRTRYPDAVGTRIDACGLCHTNVPQLNPYGRAFRDAGQFADIEPLDSDGDGASNLAEIVALTFPGDAADTPLAASPTPTSTPLPTPTATPGSGDCAGDCLGDGAVTVDDLLKAVNIALGSASVDVCTAADVNGDGMVTINELLGAVNHALDGCPA